MIAFLIPPYTILISEGTLNLIPVNPLTERNNVRTNPKETLNFQKTLENLGINATIRRELGADINASCGQLRNNEL